MPRIADPQDVRRRNRSCVNPGIECAAKFPVEDHQRGKACQSQRVPARETPLAQVLASDLSLPTNIWRSTTNPPRKKMPSELAGAAATRRLELYSPGKDFDPRKIIREDNASGAWELNLPPGAGVGLPGRKSGR